MLIVLIEATLGIPLVIATVHLERHHKKSTRTFTVFLKSLIVMVVSIMFFIGVNMVLKERLYLIDTRIFMQHGNYLSLCLFLNLLPFILYQICISSKVLLKRCLDRGCKLSLYKSDEEDSDDIYDDFAGQ